VRGLGRRPRLLPLIGFLMRGLNRFGVDLGLRFCPDLVFIFITSSHGISVIAYVLQ
jgi:hypothetical protein